MRPPDPTFRALAVLIVDAQRAGADSLARLLVLCGYPTQVAYDGAGALRIVATLVPDVILLDTDMPWTQAYELLRRLDNLPGRPLIIALSAVAEPEDSRRAYEAGFDHFLLKPLDPDVLLRLLEEHADRVWAERRGSA